DGIRDRTVTGVQTCALPIFWGKMVACNRGGVKPLEKSLNREGATARRWTRRILKRNVRNRDSTEPAEVKRLFCELRESRSVKRRSEEHTSELQSPYELVCRL